MVKVIDRNLVQLHLRPVRINYVSPKSKTLLNGPWITHVCEQDSLLRFYHPSPTDRNRPVLADEFEVERVSTYSRLVATPWFHLSGWLRYENGIDVQTSIALMPYSDEEVVEAILFHTQIAHMIEQIKSFWGYNG